MDPKTSKNIPELCVCYRFKLTAQARQPLSDTTDRMTVSVQMNERNQTAINLSAVMSGNVHWDCIWMINTVPKPMGGIIVTQSSIVFFGMEDHWVLGSIARTQNGNSCHCSIEKQKIHNNEWRELNGVGNRWTLSYRTSSEFNRTDCYNSIHDHDHDQVQCHPIAVLSIISKQTQHGSDIINRV